MIGLIIALNIQLISVPGEYGVSHEIAREIAVEAGKVYEREFGFGTVIKKQYRPARDRCGRARNLNKAYRYYYCWWRSTASAREHRKIVSVVVPPFGSNRRNPHRLYFYLGFNRGVYNRRHGDNPLSVSVASLSAPSNDYSESENFQRSKYVMVHEWGHACGAVHTNTKYRIMNPGVSPGWSELAIKDDLQFSELNRQKIKRHCS